MHTDNAELASLFTRSDALALDYTLEKIESGNRLQ